MMLTDLFAKYFLEIIIGVAGGSVGLLINKALAGIKELQTKLDALTREISELKLMVVGCYVRKTDHEATVATIFSKLEKLDDHVRQSLHDLEMSKQDKPYLTGGKR